jgi:hypothetical protein
MCKITKKLGVKVAGILLVSGCMLAGLNPAKAYGQPLDSPLYNHVTTNTVESMNAPAETNSVAGANGPAPALKPLIPTEVPNPCTWSEPECEKSIPVIPPPGELVYILTLIGGGSWAILRRKRS